MKCGQRKSVTVTNDVSKIESDDDNNDSKAQKSRNLIDKRITQYTTTQNHQDDKSKKEESEEDTNFNTKNLANKGYKTAKNSKSKNLDNKSKKSGNSNSRASPRPNPIPSNKSRHSTPNRSKSNQSHKSATQKKSPNLNKGHKTAAKRVSNSQSIKSHSKEQSSPMEFKKTKVNRPMSKKNPTFICKDSIKKSLVKEGQDISENVTEMDEYNSQDSLMADTVSKLTKKSQKSPLHHYTCKCEVCWWTDPENQELPDEEELIELGRDIGYNYRAAFEIDGEDDQEKWNYAPRRSHRSYRMTEVRTEHDRRYSFRIRYDDNGEERQLMDFQVEKLHKAELIEAFDVLMKEYVDRGVTIQFEDSEAREVELED